MLSRFKNNLALLLLLVAFGFSGNLSAQQRTFVHIGDRGGYWTVPVTNDSIVEFGVDNSLTQLQLSIKGDQIVPFAISKIDSVTFGFDPLIETKNPYKVFSLYITTADGEDITSRTE